VSAEYKDRENKPFSKKFSHATGKSETKFFEAEKIKKESPRAPIQRPASPKTIPVEKKALVWE
jgi:hypothetical protein